MSRIWKYQLNKDINREDRINIIEMPKGAEILCVKNQYNCPTLYAKVMPYYSEIELREFKMAHTGETILDEWKYIGTVLLDDGEYVLHIYEIPVDKNIKEKYYTARLTVRASF